MIKVTLEFKSVDEAIVALAKLVPPVVKKEMTNPDALKPLAELVGVPEKAPSVSSVAKQGAIPVAAPASDNTPTTQRKGRADKGKPRGPRKNVATPVEGPPVAALQTSAPVVAASETAAPSPSEVDPHKGEMTGQAASVAAALTPQQTIEAIYDKFGGNSKDAAAAQAGIDNSFLFLSRFGIKRVRDLKPEQYAEFVKHGAAVLAGGEI